ncbi:MAG: hypothetical protein OXE99_10120 [Cellvibrionales bacterium]|nr:hypothetical protein [Cellvibrionales bacterium]
MKELVIRIPLFSLFLLFTIYAYAKQPEIPFPDGVKVTIVGEDIVVNGMPLMAYEFHSRASLEDTAQFYKDYWQEKVSDSDVEHPFLEVEFFGWHMLSRLEEGYNITVQLQEDGIQGVRVLVGMSPLPTMLKKKIKPVIEYNIIQSSGFTVESFVQSTDAGKVSETYWIASRFNVDKASLKIREYYQSRSYSVDVKPFREASSPRLFASLITVHNNQEDIRFDVKKINNETVIVAVRRVK